jgi:hypothetical protein
MLIFLYRLDTIGGAGQIHRFGLNLFVTRQTLTSAGREMTDGS